MRSAGLPLWAGLPLLAFEMHYLFMLGILGFVWGTVMALFCVAVALRDPLRPPTVPLTALLIVTWFTHVVPAVIATTAVVLIVAVAHAAEREPARKVLLGTMRGVAIPVAATSALTIVWVLQSQTSGFEHRRGLSSSLRALIDLSEPLVAYAKSEYWLARALALALYVAFAVVVVLRIRQRRWIDRFDGIIAAAALLGLLTVVLPEHTNSGAGFINVRLALFAGMFLTLWLCTQLPLLAGRSRTVWYGVAAVGSIVAVTLPIVRIPALVALSGELAQVEGLAPCLPANSTFLQLNLDNGSSVSARGITPMAEQTGVLSVPRTALELGNESGWSPYYSWRFTPTARADRFLPPGGIIDEAPPSFELGEAMRGGLPLDAVVLYGRSTASDSTTTDPATRTLQQDLDQWFRRVRSARKAMRSYGFGRVCRRPANHRPSIQTGVS